MKLKYIIPVLVVLVSAFYSDKSFAQALPKFGYLGGHTAGDPIGKVLSHQNGSTMPYFLVKRQTVPPATWRNINFALVPSTPTGTYTVQNSCWGPTGSSCYIEDVWETDITDPTKVPAFYQPIAGVPVRVEVGNTTAGCTVNYVTIDDQPDGNMDGFYISPSTLPAGITYCPSTGPNTNNPAYCSPEGMVVTGSFVAPRTGLVTVVSEDSLGLATVETCASPPTAVETDFDGFLWKIDAADPNCQASASPAQRANCKIGTGEATGDIKLRFTLEGAATSIAEPYYFLASESYNIDNLILNNKMLRICVDMTNLDSFPGTYTLDSIKMGTTPILKSGLNCTALFTPNFGANNSIDFAFNYTPPTFPPPWYMTSQGDVYAGNGRSILDPDIPNGSFLISGTGVAMGDGGVSVTAPANNNYAQIGMKITDFTSTSEWPSVFPPSFSGAIALPDTGNSHILDNKVYFATVAQLQEWIKKSTAPYNVNPSLPGSGVRLAIINVIGPGTLTFDSNFKSAGNQPRILIIGSDPGFNVEIVSTPTFGEQATDPNSQPNMTLGIIAAGDITFVGSATTYDRTLIYRGFVANYLSTTGIYFTWDIGANNSGRPSALLRYDPGYIFALENLEKSGANTGLTDFDLTWEVLD